MKFISTKPRALTGLITGVAIMVLGVTALPAAAQQPPGDVGGFGFMGSNPSGKVGRDGKPLHSPSLLPGESKNVRTLAAPSETFKAECPRTVHCVVLPAAYSPNNGNVEDYGNYDKANRPADMDINSIVIHDTEGDLQSVLDAFQNSAFYASTHYVIAPDGTIYQMVQNKDMAWHAGNWSVNMHSIGIEHVGHAAAGHTEYTAEMYKASAKLVKYLSKKYDIPLDRGNILGHDNVSASRSADIAGMHVDPGPFWNWERYMWKMRAPVWPTGGFKSKMVTIAPNWSRNKPPVTGCIAENSCVPEGKQSANFVYLRTEPRHDAPLVADEVLGQGTTDIKNNAARLFYGQTFAVADRRADWHGIWYKIWANGQPGWFYSAWRAPAALPASGKYIVPKDGATSVPVYGRAIPERSEYPAELLAEPPASWYIPAPAPLPYTIKEGQRYKLLGKVPTDHFYAWASDSSFPYDHTVFHGKTKYLKIQFGNRVGYVKAEDVEIKRAW